MIFIDFGVDFGGLLGALEAHFGYQNASKKRDIFWDDSWEPLGAAQKSPRGVSGRTTLAGRRFFV